MATDLYTAAKQALEALEESIGYVQEEAENAQRLYGQYPARQARIQGLKDDARKHMDAITALREALAEQPAQQQEPVAGLLVGQDSDGRYVSIAAKAHADTLPLGEYKLYTSPPTKQEPFCFCIESENSADWCFAATKEGVISNSMLMDEQCVKSAPFPLYTSPPAQRTWVGLTDEEIESIFNNWPTYHLDHEEFARAIEAKLKQRNT